MNAHGGSFMTKETVIRIYLCENGHYFSGTPSCPFCYEPPAKTFALRDGDCVSCGQLCQKGIYGCNDPSPIEAH